MTMFPINTPKKVKTKTSAATVKFGTCFNAIFFGLIVYGVLKSSTQIPALACLAIGSLVTIIIIKITYKARLKDFYDSILFEERQFSINYLYREKLTVQYKDIVSVNKGFEAYATLITITGNYPVFQIALNPLEQNRHEDFIKYLKTNGA